MKINNKKYINLKDVLWEMMKRKGLLVLFCIIGVIVFLVYGKVHNVAAVNQYQNQLEDVMELTSKEENDVKNAVELYEQKKELEAYKKNSIMMKLDPFKVSKYVIRYCVKVAPECDDTGKVINDGIERMRELRLLYYTYCSEGALAKDVAAELGEEYTDEYISDVLTASINSTIDSYNYFTVTLYGCDLVPELKDATEKCINNYVKKISKTKPKHELRVGDKYDGVANVESIYTKQKTISNDLRNCISNLSGITPYFSKGQVAAYNKETGEKIKVDEDNVQDDLVEVTPLTIKGYVKYGICGVLFGIILFGVVIMLKHMYSSHVMSVQEFSDTFSLKYIGNICAGAEKPETDNEQNNSARVLDLAIHRLCQLKNVEKVAFISSENAILDNPGVSQFMQTVSSDGLVCVALKDVIDNASALEQLFACDACMLIEQTSVSEFSKVGNLVSECKNNEVEILGVLNVDESCEC